MSTHTPTLYEQLGGQPAVDAAVDLFYRKVLTDDRISRFFVDVDMDKQIAKQKAFLTMVFGGPMDQYQRRYTSREEAVKDHKRVVSALKRQGSYAMVS